MVYSWESYCGMFTCFVYLIRQIARELFTLVSERIHNLIINLTVRLIKRDPFLTKNCAIFKKPNFGILKYVSLRARVPSNGKPRSVAAPHEGQMLTSKDTFEIKHKNWK